MGSSRLSISIKVVIISTGVMCVGIVTKVLVPMGMYFYVNEAPHLWASFVSWLRPPYLYLLINCIIISIAASSFLHNKHHREKEEDVPLAEAQMGFEDKGPEEEEGIGGALDVPVEGVEAEAEMGGGAGGIEDKDEDAGIDNNVSVGEEEFVTSRSKWVPPPQRIDSSEKELLEAVVSYSPPPSEKPLVSSRFSHRKSPGARALRVSRPKRHETLENTWKAITEGRAMPLTRHLKKSETFYENQRARQVNVSDENNSAVVDFSNGAKKSETFRDRTNYQEEEEEETAAVVASGSSSSGKLRRESSPSQDELNRRVEAFIRKFNEEMRLQRQQSLNQYMEMVGRDI